MPRTLPEINITVASMPCLSKIFASFATQRTDEEPGVVEMYEVLSLSAAEAALRRQPHESDGEENDEVALFLLHG